MPVTILPIHKVSDKDPTRTLALRRRFVIEMNKRLMQLRSVIRHAVVDLDVLGLGSSSSSLLGALRGIDLTSLPPNFLANIQPRAFAFDSDANKILNFRTWLQEQHNDGLLELIEAPFRVGTEPWSNVYVRSSYQKGLAQARGMLKGLGADLPGLDDPFGGVSPSFYQPIHADRVALIYTRTFTSLEGVTGWMDNVMSRVLAGGLTEGIGPNEMARRLNDVIKKSTGKGFPVRAGGVRGLDRARTIARTEVTHAFNTAQLNEYEHASGIIGEPVLSQWWTAGDERVRDSHSNRHGQVYRRKEAEGLIGEPNCRCTLLPYMKTVNGPLRGGRRSATGGRLPTRTSEGRSFRRRRRGVDKTISTPTGTPTSPQQWEFLEDESKLMEKITKTQHIDFIQASQELKSVKKTELLNSIGESMDNMYTRFPGLKKKMINKPVNVIKLTKGKRVGDGVVARYTKEFREIEMPSQLLTKDTLKIGKGRHTIGTDFTSIYRHEFGHHVHRQVLSSEQRIKWVELFNERELNTKLVRNNKIKLKKINKWFKSNLSEYGGSKTSEAFAESFSSYTSPLYSEAEKKLPDFIEQFFKEEVMR